MIEVKAGNKEIKVQLSITAEEQLFSEFAHRILSFMQPNKIQEDKESKSESLNLESYKKKRAKAIRLEDDTEELKRSRLVFTKCPKCGKSHVIYFSGNTIHCQCGHVIEFRDEELKDGEYECPHCGKGRGKFKVLGVLDAVACKECNGGIMLRYDHSTHKYTNK